MKAKTGALLTLIIVLLALFVKKKVTIKIS